MAPNKPAQNVKKTSTTMKYYPIS